VIRELSGTYGGKAKFAMLNVDENPQIAERYGVMNLPTIKFFCAGRPVGEVIGYMPKDSLKVEVDRMLFTHKSCLEQSSPMHR